MSCVSTALVCLVSSVCDSCGEYKRLSCRVNTTTVDGCIQRLISRVGGGKLPPVQISLTAHGVAVHDESPLTMKVRTHRDLRRSIFLTEDSTLRRGRRVLPVTLGPHHKPFGSARTARGLRVLDLVGALHALRRAARRRGRENALVLF